jgi:hypothetical protein
MSWATPYIQKLLEGDTVKFRPRGNSMEPKIKSGQLVTVEPVIAEMLKVGEIVLCSCKGKHYLHLIKSIKGKRFQIGNNHGLINGWTGAKHIYGKVINIEN